MWLYSTHLQSLEVIRHIIEAEIEHVESVNSILYTQSTKSPHRRRYSFTKW
jgi:hypothetical protein